MNKVANLLYKGTNRNKNILLWSYVLNAVVVNIFFMLALGVENLVNDTLSKNDLEQIQAILASVIFISIMSIIFFQWIIAMQFRGLFNSRNTFNNNVSMMGLSNGSLMRIYIIEMFQMQIIAIPLGIIISEVAFYVLGNFLDLNYKFITLDKIVLAMLLHIIVILISIIIEFRKIFKSNIINRIRGKKKKQEMLQMTKKKKVGMFFSIIIFILTIYMKKTAQNTQISAFWNIGFSVAVISSLDAIIYYINQVILVVAKGYQKKYLILAESIWFGYYKKFKVVSLMIIYSISIFLGLRFMYTTVRQVGSDVVEKNIKYSHVILYDNCCVERESNEFCFYGLQFKTRSNTNANLYIKGISSEFVGKFENINLSTTNSKQSIDFTMFNSETWNGILMPDYYISSADIGKELTLNINDREVKFTIIGSYNTNNFSELTCFVSEKYLETQLGLNGMYNIKYNLNDTEENISSDMSVITKDDIKLASYNKAVGGTTLLEIISIFIIICTIVSMINYFIITSDDNLFDVARFRGLGMGRKEIRKIYAYQAVIPVIISLIIALPSAYIFESVGCYMMLPSDYYGKLTFEMGSSVATVIIFVLTALISQLMIIKKANNTSYYISLLRDNERR